MTWEPLARHPMNTAPKDGRYILLIGKDLPEPGYVIARWCAWNHEPGGFWGEVEREWPNSFGGFDGDPEAWAPLPPLE